MFNINGQEEFEKIKTIGKGIIYMILEQLPRQLHMLYVHTPVSLFVRCFWNRFSLQKTQ